jgi:DNA-binding CsgD family transcriptional regulator
MTAELRSKQSQVQSRRGIDGLDLLDAVELLSIPSYVIDPQGTIRWLNASARAIVGNAVGRQFTDVVAREYVGRAREQFLRKLHGKDATDFELEVEGAHGQRVLADVSSVAVRDGRRVVGVFGLAQPTVIRESNAVTPMLTPRQAEVLHLLAGGASTAQIQETLQLSRETVRNHISHLLRALGAHSRLEAVAMARRSGLID